MNSPRRCAWKSFHQLQRKQSTASLQEDPATTTVACDAAASMQQSMPHAVQLLVAQPSTTQINNNKTITEHPS
jgi:hypothetical protein